MLVDGFRDPTTQSADITHKYPETIQRAGKHEPKTSKFFSGNRFPLATPSSIEDHMFFFAPSLLDGLLPWLKIDDLCPIPTMLTVPCPHFPVTKK